MKTINSHNSGGAVMSNGFDPLMRIQSTGHKAITEVKTNIIGWIDSKIFQETIQAFGWKDRPDQDLKKRIDNLVALSDEWDFRNKTAKIESVGASRESTRWTTHAQLLSSRQIKLAGKVAKEFKLSCASTPSSDEYQAILVLGGARLSCLLRTKWAKEILSNKTSAQDTVLLGSERKVTDSERDATNTYAPEAKTEFDLFIAAAHTVFEINLESYKQHRHEDINPNLSWKINNYHSHEQRNILIMSAPSSDPNNRRANSVDTYKFYINHYKLKPHARLLFVTSPIYVPYQQLEAIRVLTIPLGIQVETIGFPPGWSADLQGMQGPQHYLQEMRSFLQSAQRFLTSFPA
jgi:hypothetical protein